MDTLKTWTVTGGKIGGYKASCKVVQTEEEFRKALEGLDVENVRKALCRFPQGRLVEGAKGGRGAGWMWLADKVG